MRHDTISRPAAKRSLATSRRFQLAGALIAGALLPFALRGLISPSLVTDALSLNALAANAAAIVLAFWMRLSIETYPGIRSSYVIFPVALSAHGAVVAFFLLTRLPYDRFALTLGFLHHVLWNYGNYLLVEQRARPRIAVVPFGRVDGLFRIESVDWVRLEAPRLEDAKACGAIVADFRASMPDEWVAFLADAALAGRVVYQVKQLSESLTGRVELDHLSENSFGSLLPTRAYFHFKAVVDFLVAVAALPLILPLMGIFALAIKLEDGGAVFFRQTRIGHADRKIIIYKFRTMRPARIDDVLSSAITRDEDDRVTRVGRFLRRTRLDELPQMFNILKWQMSWIGPRPEAEVLSVWYTGELPFYRYRHVVKPGISGWAQVNQGHVTGVDDVHRKLQYDFYYIKYFSPWLDLLILFRTIRTMVTGFGAR